MTTAGWSVHAAQAALIALAVGAAAAPAVWLLLRSISPRRADRRAAICLGALVLLAVSPWFLAAPAQAPPTAALATTVAIRPTPAGSAFAPAPREIAVQAESLALGLGLWALTSLGLALRTALGVAQAVGLKRRSRRPEGRLAELERCWRAAEPGGRRFDLLVSDEVRTPLAVGWARPAVIFPDRLEGRLPEEDLRLLWLHERAHVDRRDDWRLAATLFARTVFPFHPVAHWLAGRHDLEREAAVDESVAARAEDRRAYARTLLRLIEVSRGDGFRPDPVAAGAAGQISRRVQMLLGKPNRPARSTRALAAVAVAFAAAATAFLLDAPRVALAQGTPAPVVEPTPPPVPEVLPAPPQPATPPAPAAPTPSAPLRGTAPPPTIPDVRAETAEIERLAERIQAEVARAVPSSEELARMAAEIAARVQADIEPHVAELAAAAQEHARAAFADPARAQELEQRLRQAEQRLREAEERLRPSEERMREVETRVREAQRLVEERVREIEERIEEQQRRIEEKLERTPRDPGY